MREITEQNIDSIVNKSEKASTILGERERYKNLPPKIKEKKTLTLKNIAQREGCDVSELESDLATKVRQFSEKMSKNISYPSEEYFDLIDSIYNLYLQSKNPETTLNNQWLDNFQSFNDFANHFCPEATKHARAAMKKNIQIFVSAIINQEKIISIHPRDWLGVNGEGLKEIYNVQGDWVLLPGNNYDLGVFDYADRDVINEVIKLAGENYHYSDFTHSSGSAALEGIEKSRAILSAQEVESRDMKVNTGEHVSYVNQESGTPVAGGKYGLGSVYASNRGYSSGYCHINWFDEYYVAFGINKQKQADFLVKAGYKNELTLDDDSTPFLDMGSEGVEIGNEVPLTAVEIVYCWKQNQAEMSAWIQKNCPSAKLVSIEAAEILSMHSHVINKVADQEKISIEDAWRKIL